MESDTENLIWKIIGGENFCCFKYKFSNQNFCRNKFSLTGLCCRQSCPLSNNNYATIIENNGKLLLYIKKALNYSMPYKSWEKIVLSRNFIKGIQQIDLKLALWPKFFVNKTKIKLIKLTQVLIRSRIRDIQEKKISYCNYKLKTTNKKNEFNLLSKINLEKSIEQELLLRLHMGMYGNNYGEKPIQNWVKIKHKNSEKIQNPKHLEKTTVKT